MHSTCIRHVQEYRDVWGAEDVVQALDEAWIVADLCVVGEVGLGALHGGVRAHQWRQLVLNTPLVPLHVPVRSTPEVKNIRVLIVAGHPHPPHIPSPPEVLG